MRTSTPDPSLVYFEGLPVAALVLELLPCPPGQDPASDTERLRVVTTNAAAERLLGPLPIGAAFGQSELTSVAARVAATGEPAPPDELFLAGPGRVMLVHAFPCGEARVGLLLDDTAACLHQAVLDCVPSTVFVKSAADGRYIRVNTACEVSTGTRREVAIGKCLADLVPPDSAREFAAADARVFAGGAEISFDEVLPTPDGPRHMHTTKRPLYFPDGSPRAIIGVSHDVTEQVASVNALARSRDELDATRTNLLATILELSTPVLPIDDGVLVVPLVGRLDDQRGRQFIDTLLAGIQRHRAATVILDITGLELAADGPALLVRATRAAALLGTECVLVGITPAVATTLVALGTDFGGLVTCADLQAGVAHARARRT